MAAKRRTRGCDRLSIGSAISGTLKAEDLIPAFIDLSLTVEMNAANRARVYEIKHEFEKFPDEDDWTADQRDRADEMIEDIGEILNHYCPPFTYFGANDGDGADFGVWVGNEVPFHGNSTEDIGKGPNLPMASKVFQAYWLQVNDHGNCTLWEKRRHGAKGWKWYECWSLV